MNKHIVIPLVLVSTGFFTLGIPGVFYFDMGYPIYFLSDLIFQTDLIETLYHSNMGDNVWPLLILLSLIIPFLYIGSYLYFRKKFQGMPLFIRAIGSWYILAVLSVAIITKLAL